MKLTQRIGILTAIAVTMAQGVSAQTPMSLTLDDAIVRGLAHAPRLGEARARVSAAEARVDARQALHKPTITASSSYLRTNHVEEFGVPQPGGAFRILFPDIPDNYRTRAELLVPVYTAGRTRALVEAARAEGRAAAADERTTAADLRLEISRAYWALVTARETVTVLEQALARTDVSVRDVKARVETGVVPPNELQSAQAQRARQLVRVIQARNDAVLAEADLARLIGSPGQRFQPITSLDRPVPGAVELASVPLDALIARARDGRKERTALLERQAALRSGGTASAAAARPQIAAIAAVEPARPNPRFVPRMDEWRTSWDLGVNVTWQFWDGGRGRAERAAALAQADAIGHRIEEFDALVALEIRQRQLDLEAARAAVVAAGEAVTAATEARRVLDERFAVGVATSTEVLDAQVVVLEAELERTRWLAAERLAEARLVRSIGGL